MSVCLYPLLSSIIARAPCYIVICGQSGSAIFLHIISQAAQFSEQKIIERKIRVLIFSATFVWHNSHFNKSLAR
jgi:hypothetical protein